MGRSSRQTLRHKEEKDGEVARLKKAIKRLQREKQMLISQLSTVEKAFEKNVLFLKKSTNDLTVDQLVQAAKKEMSLAEIKAAKIQELEDKKEELENMKLQWKCYKCEAGVLQIVTYSNRAGTFYFRACSNHKLCTNRTLPQPYSEDVKGIKCGDTTKKK